MHDNRSFEKMNSNYFGLTLLGWENRARRLVQETND